MVKQRMSVGARIFFCAFLFLRCIVFVVVIAFVAVVTVVVVVDDCYRDRFALAFLFALSWYKCVVENSDFFFFRFFYVVSMLSSSEKIIKKTTLQMISVHFVTAPNLRRVGFTYFPSQITKINWLVCVRVTIGLSLCSLCKIQRTPTTDQKGYCAQYHESVRVFVYICVCARVSVLNAHIRCGYLYHFM